MKKSINLLVVFVFFFAVSINAQSSMKIYLPNWKSQDCYSRTMNFGAATFTGHRTSKTESQNYSRRGAYEYRTLKPLLVKIEAPEGVKKVSVNIDGSFVSIIGAPEGSIFLDKNHAIVPVVGNGNVVVENPIRWKDCKNLESEKLRYDWEDIIDEYDKDKKRVDNDNFSFSNFIKSNFIIKSSEKGCNESGKDQEFQFSNNETYVVLSALNKGKANIYVSSFDAYGNDQTVVGHLNFKDGNDLVKCEKKKSDDFRIEIALTTLTPNITFTNKDKECPTVKFKAEIYNDGDVPIDLKEALIAFAPKGNWCKNGIIEVRNIGEATNKTELMPGKKVIVKMINSFVIDDNILLRNLKEGIAVFTAQARILYPTSPEKGKNTEGDVTVSYNFVGGGVGNIGQKFVGGKRYVFNVSPEANTLVGVVHSNNINCNNCKTPALRDIKWHKDNDGKIIVDLYSQEQDMYFVGYARDKASVTYRLYNGKQKAKERTIKLK